MADPGKQSIMSSTFSTYMNSLTADAKQRYSTKLLYDSGTASLPDPYALTEKWSIGDIYLYLIDTPSNHNKDSMTAYKSLEAYK